MKPFQVIFLFLAAFVFNAVLFLMVPTFQAAFHTPLAKKAPGDSVVRELAPPETPPEKVVQRPIQEIQLQAVNPPSLTQSRPSAPGGGLKLDLSAAGGEGLALVSGGDRTGPLGSGTGGGKGAGIGSMVYQPGQTDADAQPVGPNVPSVYPARAERENVSGFADIFFVVSEAGFATQMSVIREDPPGYGFAASGMETLRKMRFKPATIQNTPVKQQFHRVFTFQP